MWGQEGAGCGRRAAYIYPSFDVHFRANVLVHTEVSGDPFSGATFVEVGR